MTDNARIYQQGLALILAALVVVGGAIVLLTMAIERAPAVAAVAFVCIAALLARTAAERATLREAEAATRLATLKLEEAQGLSRTYEWMTRERQRRALQSLFERFDFDKNGELVSLIPREWARDAFGELSVALKQISPAMPSTGIPHDAGLIYQLLAIVIVGAKSYFT